MASVGEGRHIAAIWERHTLRHPMAVRVARVPGKFATGLSPPPVRSACGIGRKVDFAAGRSGVSVRFSAPLFLRQTVSGRFRPLLVWLSISFKTVIVASIL